MAANTPHWVQQQNGIPQQPSEVQMQAGIRSGGDGGIARAKAAFESPQLHVAGAPTFQRPGGQQPQGPHRFTLDQLRATDGVIPLQSGTNQFASQQGMTGFGTARNTSTPIVTSNPDLPPSSGLPAENPNLKIGRWTLAQLRAGEGIVRVQSGTNQFSSQKGMKGGFGSPRDVAGHHIHRIWEAEGYFEQPEPQEEMLPNYQAF